MTIKKSIKELRFEREAKALQKNLAKRKQQQAEFDKRKTENANNKEQNNG
jgi:hypothetical protein